MRFVMNVGLSALIFTYNYVIYRRHRLRGTGSTVVTMTSKVKKMEILTPYRSETPESIETTRNILDCDQSNYSSRIIFSCRLFLQAAL